MRYPGGMLAEKDSGCETSRWNVGGEEFPDVRYPGGMSTEKNSGCEIPWWNVGEEGFRM